MAGGLFRGIPVPLVASALKSANGNSGSLKNLANQFPVCLAAALILDVTASSAPTTLDVSIETSPDAGTSWYTAYEFTQVGAVATAQRRLDIRDTGIGITEVGAEGTIVQGTSPLKVNTVMTEDIRVRWVIAGTSYTFAVWGIFQPMGTTF